MTGLIQTNTVEPQTSLTSMQKHIIQLEPASVRTPEHMQRDDVKSVNISPIAIPFRPTIDSTIYQQLKAAAQLTSGGFKPNLNK